MGDLLGGTTDEGTATGNEAAGALNSKQLKPF